MEAATFWAVDCFREIQSMRDPTGTSDETPKLFFASPSQSETEHHETVLNPAWSCKTSGLHKKPLS
jgi:hypothetical protein